ncbi:hypothetical protein PLICRDRAFT_567989 [Plicaturopsis crispa FD-325 SS-3]|nr:hypothetical protein PLICRDRAFT_567989 [Plicaturopsis crispa FD-325 SS-3]
MHVAPALCLSYARLLVSWHPRFSDAFEKECVHILTPAAKSMLAIHGRPRRPPWNRQLDEISPRKHAVSRFLGTGHCRQSRAALCPCCHSFNYHSHQYIENPSLRAGLGTSFSGRPLSRRLWS